MTVMYTIPGPTGVIYYAVVIVAPMEEDEHLGDVKFFSEAEFARRSLKRRFA